MKIWDSIGFVCSTIAPKCISSHKTSQQKKGKITVKYLSLAVNSFFVCLFIYMFVFVSGGGGLTLNKYPLSIGHF